MVSEIRNVLDGIVRIDNTEIDVSHHQFMILKFISDWMENDALKFANGTLLDFGCGGQPYRKMFEQKCSRYIAADVAIASNSKVDILIEPNKELPLETGTIDTILSTQVLEHVSDFNHYMAECRRVLAKDGYLIISVPMQWKHHEVPFDFWRFTKFGISDLILKNNFELVSIKPTGGAFVLIGQILLNYMVETRQVKTTSKINKMIFKLINKLSLRLDRKFPSDEDTLCWLCIARKL